PWNERSNGTASPCAPLAMRRAEGAHGTNVVPRHAHTGKLRGEALALEVFEVPHELGPAGEAILARDDELGVSELRGRIDRGMASVCARQGFRVAGAQAAKQGLGFLVLELEAWPGREWPERGHAFSFRCGPCPPVGPE